ncbi:unnamed protein product [Calypogeia fissa]
MEIGDLPVEESSRSIEEVEGFEAGFGNPVSSSSEVPNDNDHHQQQHQHQQSPSRKRKLEEGDEDESGFGPHQPALKVLHVDEGQEQEYEQQQHGEQNNYPQSALSTSQLVGELSTTSQMLEENSSAASIEDKEDDEAFIRNAHHQSALEALLADEDDPSGNSCKESLSELIRSAVADGIPSGHEYNNMAFRTAFEPPPILGEEEEGLRNHEIRSGAEVQNVLSTSRSPLPNLKTLHGVEIAEGAQVLVSNPIQSEFEDSLSIGENSLGPEATEMHVNVPQSELEAPQHVLQSGVEDDAQLRISDPQSVFEALPAEEGKFVGHETSEMPMDDNPHHPQLSALPVEGKRSETEAETRLEYSPQLELEALPVEENGGENETEMHVDLHHHRQHRHHHPQTELEALQRVEALMEGEDDATQMLPVGDDPCSELGFVHAVISAAQDVANVSVSDPHRDLQTQHFVEKSRVENESNVGMNDHPQSELEVMDAVTSERVQTEANVQQVGNSLGAELGAPMEVEFGENNSAEDPQSPEKRRKMILLAAVAAFFSTLAGALGSIGELIGQLEKTAMGGVSEDRDRHLHQPGVDGMTRTSSSSSSSSLYESTALRLHSAMTRSSSSLRNNIVVSMFLLMQEHRKRTQKRPRELTGPWYIKPRSAQAVESFLDFSPQGDPENFRELFRISPNLFFHICEMVRDEMLSDTPRSLRVLPNRVLTVERQVAIAIRRLATGNQFLGIADSFGVSKSTAVKVTWKFIVAFIKKARPLHLQWPNVEQMQQIKDGFRTQWGFPNCCGVVDGTHFTVEFPKGEDVTQYCDHQNHVSISMQAIVGHDQRFLDVVVGWPGSIQEYQLLQNTNFFRNVVVTKERLHGVPCITQDGSSLREYVLGDGGYPLYDWLMVPYPSGISAAKDEWNSRHAVARQCVEDALVRLKGTWRILSRILWKPRKERIGKMVFACCLLHNMIIERQDGLNPEVYAGVNPHPGGYTGVSIPTDEVFEGGPEAREVLFREVMGGGII